MSAYDQFVPFTWWYYGLGVFLYVALRAYGSWINFSHRCPCDSNGGTTSCELAYRELSRRPTYRRKKCQQVGDEFLAAHTVPTFQPRVVGRPNGSIDWPAILANSNYSLIKPRIGFRAGGWADLDDDEETGKPVLVLAFEPVFMWLSALRGFRSWRQACARHELVHALQQDYREVMTRAWRCSFRISRYWRFMCTLPGQTLADTWRSTLTICRHWLQRGLLVFRKINIGLTRRVSTPPELCRSALILFLLSFFRSADIWCETEVEAHVRSGTWKALAGFFLLVVWPLAVLAVTSPYWLEKIAYPVIGSAFFIVLFASFLRMLFRWTLFPARS